MRSGCVSEAISITQLFSLRCLTQAGALTAATPAMTGGFISTTSYAKKLQSCAARQDRRGEWLALPMLLLRLLHGGTLRRSCRVVVFWWFFFVLFFWLLFFCFFGLFCFCCFVFC